MFTTARLRLRGSTPNDADNLLALYNDPQVAPWITEGYIVPKHASYLDTINAFIASCVLSCVVEELETGEFVGLSSFVGQGEAKNRNAIMCIALLPRHWNKGYGAEVMSFLIDYAFHDMGMHRVSLTVFEGNERAMALYRRLGFVEEGRHRKIVWMKGAWKDTYYMGILEDEWRERKQREAEAEHTFHTQIAYDPPSLPVLLSLSAYLYLLSATNALSETVTNAPLLGPLLTGILLGPSVAGLLTPALQESLIALGYIGLLLIVFEAGLSTHLPLLFANAGLSCAAALTGILVPIALSMALLKGAYGYTALQAFAAGAALCSTSLGTTLALLIPPLRRTRVGSVLMVAALLDDVVGLVIAGIIPGLAGAEAEGQGVRWETIVRPILVSIAFGVGTPALAWVLRRGVLSLSLSSDRSRSRTGVHTSTCTRVVRLLLGLVHDIRTQLFLIVLALSAFVAGTKYAGTSELFGAYLAGAFLAYIFTFPYGPAHAASSHSDSSSLAKNVQCISSKPPLISIPSTPAEPYQSSSPSASPGPVTPAKTPSSSSVVYKPQVQTQTEGKDEDEPHNLPLAAFNTYLQPILTPLLGPVFFASIGAAIPVRSLFTVRGSTGATDGGGGESHAVVWKGLVYALLMVLGKMVVGVWMLVWPEPKTKGGSGARAHGEGGRLMKRLKIGAWVGAVMAKPKFWRNTDENNAREGRDARVVEEGGVAPVPASVAVVRGKTTPQSPNALERGEPTRRRAAALLGLAMVARGEIALIVAQLARPLLVGSGSGGEAAAGASTNGGGGSGAEEEPYAVVVWAIVVSTVGGAVGVGLLLGSWRRRDRDERGERKGGE